MNEDFKDQEHIDDLRRRLYARGPENSVTPRHTLTDTEIDVARDWGTPNSETEEQVIDVKPKSSYRQIVLLGSLLIFFVAAALSSAYLYFGGNRISSENIDISLNGPNTIGGGEKIDVQIGLSNQNAVAIESATLIVRYPSGSRTTEEPIENLFEERIWIDTMNPGEAKNISIQASVFGEEGDEKEINATLEYRIAGSNGTFYIDAEPLKFQIVSSPIVMQVKSVRKVASGQEVEVQVEVKSNASSEFKNLLISASYPNGFSYKQSSPEPVFGQNVWRIEELKPEQSTLITIKGTIKGLTDEALRLNFSAGPADPNNQFIVGATLTDAYTEFQIEKPFIDVEVLVNGENKSPAILESGQDAGVQIKVNNTLDESVYDMVVEVVPGGNALQTGSIKSRRGYYDSNTGIMRWEVANNEDLAQVLPGESRTLDFSILAGASQSTASFDLVVNVYGRRVAERSAQEQLVGTVLVQAKYSSNISVNGMAKYISGPIPPKVGQSTSYSITLKAAAGINDTTNAVLKTQLPIYVIWENEYAADGTVTYNTVSRELEWQAGNIDGGKSKDLVFKVSLVPSSSQVGTKPVLVNKQTFTAKDRFTTASLTAESPLITTELPQSSGYEENNGKVE